MYHRQFQGLAIDKNQLNINSAFVTVRSINSFIHLDTESLNQARVVQRVSEGGHHVPEDKVSNRIPRVLKNIKQAMPLCEHCYLLDNSRLDNPFQPIAEIHNGQISLKTSLLPNWGRALLIDYLDLK